LAAFCLSTGAKYLTNWGRAWDILYWDQCQPEWES
jgi:hypothetical protein